MRSAITLASNHTQNHPKYYYWKDNDLYIAVYIQTRASKNKIVGKHGNRLKIQITAPPIEGKANDELTKFLAKLFSIPRTQVRLISGLQGRNKLVQIKYPNKNTESLLP